jgi:hypothetical protein
MTNSPDSQGGQHVEEVMQGAGFYNAHSRPQHAAGDFALPMLQDAVAALPVPVASEVFTAVDYGSSQGRNSMAPMKAVIEAVRGRTKSVTPVAVIHTDLPGNDFTSLFELLEHSPDSYRRGVPDVFALAAGESFYKQILPPAQVWLGHSSITVHWLSAAPSTIPGQIWSPRATGAVRSAFAERARQDWLAFLQARAVELRPGGRLVIVGSGANDSGNSGAESLVDLANSTLQALVSEGTLAQDEYEQMVIPTYYRTMAEFCAPFAAGPLAATLRLVKNAPAVLPDVLWQTYEQNRDTQGFAQAYADFFIAAYAPSLFGALDATRREQILAAFRQHLQQRIATDPQQAECRWQLILLAIEKRAA